MQRLKIIYFEQECVKQLCVIFFFKEMLCAILKGVDVGLICFKLCGFFLYTRVLQVEQICQWNENKPEMLKLLLVLFLSALTLNEKPVINSD